jgi:hypothetical protein
LVYFVDVAAAGEPQQVASDIVPTQLFDADKPARDPPSGRSIACLRQVQTAMITLSGF